MNKSMAEAELGGRHGLTRQDTQIKEDVKNNRRITGWTGHNLQSSGGKFSVNWLGLRGRRRLGSAPGESVFVIRKEFIRYGGQGQGLVTPSFMVPAPAAARRRRRASPVALRGVTQLAPRAASASQSGTSHPRAAPASRGQSPRAPHRRLRVEHELQLRGRPSRRH
jgi:hypothetical protein